MCSGYVYLRWIKWIVWTKKSTTYTGNWDCGVHTHNNYIAKGLLNHIMQSHVVVSYMEIHAWFLCLCMQKHSYHKFFHNITINFRNAKHPKTIFSFEKKNNKHLKFMMLLYLYTIYSQIWFCVLFVKMQITTKHSHVIAGMYSFWLQASFVSCTYTFLNKCLPFLFLFCDGGYEWRM